MTKNIYTDLAISDLGIGAGLVVLGFRACVYGRQSCRCIESLFMNTLGPDGAKVLADILVFTKVLGSDGKRMINLSPPGGGRVTHDEIMIACVFSAAQAWDTRALRTHLRKLLGMPPSDRLAEIVHSIADQVAASGHAVMVPDRVRRVPQGVTPAFRLAVKRPH